MRRRNITAAVVLIAGGLIYGALALGLPTRSLPNTPGPSFFPLVVTAIVLALSAALLLQALAADRAGERPVAEDAFAGTADRRPALWALAAFLAYVVLLPIVGFIIATVPFLGVLMLLFGERRPLFVLV